MPHVLNRAASILRLERAVENRHIVRFQVRGSLNGIVLLDRGQDGADVRFRITEILERLRHDRVHHLDHAAAHQPFIAHERDLGLDAGRIAIHEERNGAGRRDHRDLRVLESMLPPRLKGFIPGNARLRHEVVRHAFLRYFPSRRAVHIDDVQKRLTVLLVEREGAELSGDCRGLAVGHAGHERGNRGREIPALVRVVRKSAAHKKRPEIGIANAQRPVIK